MGTAAACIELGLRSSPSGLQLHAVSCKHIAGCVPDWFPDLKALLAKLQASTAQKYFVLTGQTQGSLLMAIKLKSIVIPKGISAERCREINDLVNSVQVIHEQYIPHVATKPVLLPAGHEPSPVHINNPSSSQDVKKIEVSLPKP